MFAANAIGFYLDLDDKLTPALAKAGTRYSRFVKQLDRANDAAMVKMNRLVDLTSQLVTKLEDIPNATNKAYAAYRKGLRTKLKPLTQRINLSFSPGNQKDLKRVITQAIAGAFKFFRMMPAIPMRRTPGFRAGPLRQFYRSEAQPPDYIGKLKIPRFHKGGRMAGGASRNGREALAILQENEMVLPANAANVFSTIRDTKGRFMADFDQRVLAKAVVELGKAVDEAKALQIAMQRGLDPEAPQAFADKMKEVNKSVHFASYLSHNLNRVGKAKLLTLIDDIKQGLVPVNQQLEEAQETLTGIGAVMARILGTARSLLILQIGQSLSNVTADVDDLRNQLGLNVEPVESFYDNMNELNTVLGLARPELLALGKAVIESAQSMGLAAVGPAQLGEALNAMTEAGVRSQAMMKRLAPVIATVSKVTNVGMDALAKVAYELQSKFGLGDTEVESVFATLRKLSVEGNIAFGDLLSDLSENLAGGLGAQLQTLPPAARRSAMLAASQVQTAFSSAFMGSVNFGKLVSEARLNPTEESGQMFQRLFGMSVADYDKLVASGRGGDFIKAAVQSMSQLGPVTADTIASLGFTQQALGATGIDASDFVKMVNQSRDLQGAFDRLKTSTVDAAGASAFLAAQLDASQSGFAAFASRVKNFVVSALPDEVLSFFDELGIQGTAAAYIIGRDVVKALGAVIGKMVAFRVAATSTAATGGAAAAGFFGTIGKAAIGIGPLIASIGAGTGAAITSLFTGLAGGLTALGAAVSTGVGLAGLVAAVGLLYAVIGAVKWGGSDLTNFIDALSKLTVSSMVALGVGLAGLAVGIMALGPALLAFKVTTFLLPGGASGAMMEIANVVAQTATAFSTVPGGLEAATKNVELGARMLAAIGTMGMVIGGGSIAWGLLSATPIGLMVRFIVGNPFKAFLANVRAIRNTINTTAKLFAQIDVSKITNDVVERGKKIGALLGAIGQMTAAISSAAALNTRAAYEKGGGIWRWAKLFLFGDDIKAAEANIPAVLNMTVFMANALADAKLDSATVDKAVENSAQFKRVLESISPLGTIASQMVANAPSGGVWGAIRNFIWGSSSDNVQQWITDIAAVVTHTVSAFAGMGPFSVEGLTKTFDNASAALSGMLRVYQAAASVATAVTDTNADDIRSKVEAVGDVVLSATKLYRRLASDVLSQAQIRYAIMLQGQMQATDTGTHERLDRLIGIMQTFVAGTTPATATVPSAPRSPTPFTQSYSVGM